MKFKNRKFEQLLYVIALLIFSFGFIAFLSTSTSFFYKDLQSIYDPIVFYIVGDHWFNDGLLPYVDLWDLKGPIIHFINGLGSLFGCGLYGLMPIQVLSLFLSLIFTYYIFNIELSQTKSFLLSIVSLLLFSLVYEIGDTVEEYVLPFLVLSYYDFYKWVKDTENAEYKHNYKYSFFYGIVLGFSLLTRLTNALGCMGGVFFICLVLIFKKEWGNLIYNAISFICGFCFITLPFITYFAYHDALSDMWYGTILYNLEYAASSHMDNVMDAMLTTYIFGTVLLSYGFILIIRKETRLEGGLWIFSTLLLQIWLSHSNGYSHYGILGYPYLPIFLTSIYRHFGIIIKYNKLQIFILIIISFLLFVRHAQIASVNSKLYFSADGQALIAEIPQSERNSLVIYSSGGVELYYYNNIVPKIPYFILQDADIEQGPSLANRIVDSFKSKKPRWVLYCPERKKSVITNIIKSDYKLYNIKGKFMLYRAL